MATIEQIKARAKFNLCDRVLYQGRRGWVIGRTYRRSTNEILYRVRMAYTGDRAIEVQDEVKEADLEIL